MPRVAGLVLVALLLLWASLQWTHDASVAFFLRKRTQLPPLMTNASDLTLPGRTIWVVTTASLPWQTGTSVNPTLRAAYLQQLLPARKVALVLPWLGPDDQAIVFGAARFSDADAQRRHVQQWIAEDAGMPSAAQSLSIVFYRSRYVPEFGSIFPTENLMNLIPDSEADVAILEEPEHLTWLNPDTHQFWKAKFQHVVGIIHTNYVAYSRMVEWGILKTPVLYTINRWVVGAHCNRIVKLSAVLQPFAPRKEVVSNVHGVRAAFLEVGDASVSQGFPDGPYFISKMLWQKGFPQLFRLLRFLRRRTNLGDLHLDVYGGGPDQKNIISEAEQKGFNITFHPATPHSRLTRHKVMINPSVSEVLCTTTAEALAMGKFVICPVHPSNEFFRGSPNCLQYRSRREFVAHLRFALENDPVPLSPVERRRFSWEAATERLVEASRVPDTRAYRYRDGLGARLHAWLTQGRRGQALQRLATRGLLGCDI